jgi:putative peptidoglycan lipid II flippase
MTPQALAEVAHWGRIGAWSLPPQALITIALAALAAQERLRVGAWAYAAALAGLLVAHPVGGATLMAWLDVLCAAIALVLLRAVRPAAQGWLPWPALGAAGSMLLLCQAALLVTGLPAAAATQWALAILAALAVFAASWAASADLRASLAR